MAKINSYKISIAFAISVLIKCDHCIRSNIRHARNIFIWIEQFSDSAHCASIQVHCHSIARVNCVQSVEWCFLCTMQNYFGICEWQAVFFLFSYFRFKCSAISWSQCEIPSDHWNGSIEWSQSNCVQIKNKKHANAQRQRVSGTRATTTFMQIYRRNKILCSGVWKIFHIIVEWHLYTHSETTEMRQAHE